MRIIFIFILFSLSLASLSGQNIEKKNRVIILTDIEADPDDTQSLVRLLLYSNQIDIKGIIATTSCWHTSEVNPESIKKVIDAYGEVQPKLLKHEPGFPDAKALAMIVKEGLPKYGMKGVGDGMDSEGSDWIIKLLDEDDDRPLWISTWGGVNTLAQALYKIKSSKTENEARRLISKLRVYTISDQDDSGNWIRNNFPDLFYIVSPGDDYGSATWTGINSYIRGIDNTCISNSWIAQNIQQNHGPLGAAYPDVAWGVEGDTPAFLALIPNGMNEPEHPDWGGWGGRYEFTVKSKENFTLDALETSDPDGDSFSFLWFNYPEAGTYKKLIKVNGAENVHMANFTAPEVDREETAHFILKVTDKGEPQLSRYARVIVSIVPR